MNISKKSENGKITLVLEGRLDTTSAPQLEEVLIPSLGESKEVILDFSQIAYVSSAGLRVLLQGQKLAIVNDSAMILSGVSEDIMEIFEMTGFKDVMTIV